MLMIRSKSRNPHFTDSSIEISVVRFTLRVVQSQHFLTGQNVSLKPIDKDNLFDEEENRRNYHVRLNTRTIDASDGHQRDLAVLFLLGERFCYDGSLR